jgi:hypothetical protein
MSVLNVCAFASNVRLAFAEYLSSRDELALTQKKDKEFTGRRRTLERAQGRLRQCRAREAHHRDEEHTGNRSPSEEEAAPKIARLRDNIELGDEDSVQQAVFDLSPIVNGWKAVPDEVVEQLLTTLRNEKMYASHAYGHVLNYFEFESPPLTA